MMRPYILSITAFLLSGTIALAADTSCPEHFAGGKAPSITNQKMSPKTRDVCYSEYALKHSGLTRTPLYSAEHLTSVRLAQAKGMKRSSKFFPIQISRLLSVLSSITTPVPAMTVVM